MIDRFSWVWSIVVDSIDLCHDGFGIDDVDDYRAKFTIARDIIILANRRQSMLYILAQLLNFRIEYERSISYRNDRQRWCCYF
jgi:hypothetical protein